MKGKSNTHHLSNKCSKLVLVDDVCELESDKRIKIDVGDFQIEIKIPSAEVVE